MAHPGQEGQLQTQGGQFILNDVFHKFFGLADFQMDDGIGQLALDL